MMVNWEYYDKPEFEFVTAKYLPAMGEGSSLAEQIVTAVTKLVYKWYNDGDVFDNTGAMTGWCNDLSSYANWLYKHTDAKNILEGIWHCFTDSDYEDLLKELADKLLDAEDLEREAEMPIDGSIYDCDGPFRFEEYNDDEEDDEW